MLGLDNHTILVLASAVSLLLASAMVLTSASLEDCRGPGFWAVGFCGLALSSLLVSLQGALHPLVSVVAANTGVVFFQCLVSHGLLVFLGVSRRPFGYAAACLATFLGFGFFSLVIDSYPGRAVVFSLVYAAVMGETAWCLRKHQEDRLEPAYWFALGAFLAPVGLMGLRVVLVFTAQASPQGLLQPRGPTTLAVLTVVLSSVAMCLGLIMLASARFARETERDRASLHNANLGLTEALNNVKTLKGLLPICSYCMKIRDSRDSWHPLESYLASHSEADFKHSVCPDCIREHYPEVAAKVAKQRAEG